MVKYGRLTPPELPLNKIKKVPIAMFVGAEDGLGTVMDTQWEANQIGERVIHYEIIQDFDHEAFLLGRDMSYMDRALELVKEHNPVSKSEALTELFII